MERSQQSQLFLEDQFHTLFSWISSMLSSTPSFRFSFFYAWTYKYILWLKRETEVFPDLTSCRYVYEYTWEIIVIVDKERITTKFQAREIAVTKVLVTNVIFFLLCHILKHFLSIFELSTVLTSNDHKHTMFIPYLHSLGYEIQSMYISDYLILLKVLSNFMVCLQCSAGCIVFTYQDRRYGTLGVP